MPKILKAGVVGCGAIGSFLAEAIIRDFSGSVTLVCLYDCDREKTIALSEKLKNKKLAVFHLKDVCRKADLIIEATRAESAFAIAKSAIAASCDIMVLSVGGILRHYRQLARLAAKKGVRIFVPSGAITGIDGLKAAAEARINKVVLTTKKPPRAFIGVPYVTKKGFCLDGISEDTLIFEGNALAAIKAFPRNINVAATLSIAGVGPKKTTIRIIASPHINRNIHEITIESEAGRLFSRTENVIHPDNPKTSYLAALSAAATLKQVTGPIKIGT